MKQPRHYELQHLKTASATGYFAPVPVPDGDVAAQLAHLADHPFDEFLHRHLLRRICTWEPSRRRQLATDGGPVIEALCLEAALICGDAGSARADAERLAPYSPLIDLRSESLPDQPLHRQWARRLGPNLDALRPVVGSSGLPVLPLEPTFAAESDGWVAVDRLAPAFPVVGREHDAPPEAVARQALQRLADAGVPLGREMRHVASLSPLALLREWHFSVRVRSGRLEYRFSGRQTSYGRGFSVETARVRCTMEIIERVSAFVSVDGDHLPETRSTHDLVYGPYRKLATTATPVLDPNRLQLEVPYRDEPLFWIAGERPSGAVRIPFQCVPLFANLDEPAIFSALGSTGLAAGGSPQAARRNALLELIERDAEATHLFDPERCFRIAADDPYIAALLADYAARGIAVQFQEITGPFGIPCYRAFVRHADGAVARGTGAGLDGRFALLSALTETPYPYPAGPPSAQGMPDLPVRRFEDLPNYAGGGASRELALLEAVLAANRFEPIYVDLTRRDLDIPVVRALVPGLEIMADFDRFSRVSPRLVADCRRLSRAAPFPIDRKRRDW